VKGPPFPCGIHLQRDTDTRSQCGKEQFNRIRAYVVAADVCRFVGVQQMRTYRNVLSIVDGSGFHSQLSVHGFILT
jgi:hypothetical protein